MKQIKDLNKYVKNSSGYTVDFFNVSKFKIVSIVKDTVIVDVDTGKGEYCIRIYLSLIEGKDKRSKEYFLKGYRNRNENFLSPWFKKDRICPR